jgi:hypothetical protein
VNNGIELVSTFDYVTFTSHTTYAWGALAAVSTKPEGAKVALVSSLSDSAACATALK